MKQAAGKKGSSRLEAFAVSEEINSEKNGDEAGADTSWITCGSILQRQHNKHTEFDR